MKLLGVTLFEKDSVDNFDGVLVPLAQATRHPSVAAEYARRRSAEGGGSPENGSARGAEIKGDEKTGRGGSDADGEDGVLRTESDEYSPYTIEGLRAEVMEDLSAGGHDTAYDCECLVCLVGFDWRKAWEGF